tara:strand:+ start:1825 stop:2688 length:864 start_codon:yes stop_codon:yes gene_type:complete
MKIKHSKYKNSGILFELLVRQITSDTLEGKDSPIKEILKKYFVKTELGKEYKLYETLLNKTSLTEAKADLIINTLIESSKMHNRKLIKHQKYNLISDIQKHYNLNEFFNHKLPHYKVHAAFHTLLEIYNSQQFSNPEYIITNKMTILEHLTAAKIQEEEVRDNILSEFKKEDKDVRILTYRILLEKFNGKYDELNNDQKEILKELIYSIDNKPKLKEFYLVKTTQLRSQLKSLNKNVIDKVTKIKINEIISLIAPSTKNSKITDDHLVNLLQYCDLVKELKLANEHA